MVQKGNHSNLNNEDHVCWWPSNVRLCGLLLPVWERLICCRAMITSKYNHTQNIDCTIILLPGFFAHCMITISIKVLTNKSCLTTNVISWIKPKPFTFTQRMHSRNRVFYSTPPANSQLQKTDQFHWKNNHTKALVSTFNYCFHI